jgi:glycosyltransferase involved in cell wall biosynthesis
MTQSSRPTVLIYRYELLPWSETFIRSQATALRRYEPAFLGVRRVAGLDLSGARILLVGEGTPLPRLYQMAFVRFGHPSSTLIGRLRELSPALVHAHFAFEGHWASAVARALGVPLVVTLHGSDVTTNDAALSPSYRRYRSEVFRDADHLIAVSGFIRDVAVSRGCARDRITVLSTGVDLASFPVMSAHERPPAVLFMGRLVANKGCDYLIRAMAIVQRDRPDARLIVVGDGPLRAFLERLAAARLGNYDFLGVKSPEQVRALLDQAQVLCVPSIQAQSGASEGLGMVFLEAQAAGLPVVSFATGGITEAVEQGVTGLLAAAGDEEGLAANILTLLRDRDLRERMGRAGRARVEARFDLAVQTRALEELYDRVVSNARRQAR